MNYFDRAQYAIHSWLIALTQKDTIDFAVGGQAVIEGVMMRSPQSISIAVRRPDKTISVDTRHYRSLIQKHKLLNIPLLRGVINLIEMMIIGTKAINYSAAVSLGEEPEHKEKTGLSRLLENLMFVLSFIVAIGFSLLLFKFVPLWTTTFLEQHSTVIQNNFILFNAIDGTLKMTIFLLYIWILSLFKSFHRIFEYHGAEHKAIFNYESKEPLTVANARSQIRFHPRCGTSFIIIVFLISIFFYTLVPRPETFALNLLMRITLLPVIAGISYECLKISARYINHLWVKVLVTPGLLFQRLTTKEPDDSQLEVGLSSLKAALASALPPSHLPPQHVSQAP